MNRRPRTQKGDLPMSQVAIRKMNDVGKGPAIFDEIAKRFEEVERRAFDLFEKRGREVGHELEDWLNAEHELLGWPKRS
jgi:hypothetical protein